MSLSFVGQTRYALTSPLAVSKIIGIPAFFNVSPAISDSATMSLAAPISTIQSLTGDSATLFRAAHATVSHGPNKATMWFTIFFAKWRSLEDGDYGVEFSFETTVVPSAAARAP